MQDHRQIALEAWLKKNLANTEFNITKLAGDASFRRYFRIHTAQQTFVAMDAPPEKENCQPFVAVAKSFAAQGILVPEVLAADLNLGFLLLSDLGDRLLLAELQSINQADYFYTQALEIIPQIQSCLTVTDWNLPKFGEQIIKNELQLFIDWFLVQHLQIKIDKALDNSLQNLFSILIQAANEQPQVCVHRDFHSRNLMCLDENKIGILDFQDAVIGPITYDAVSLLRDCYIAWPIADVSRWVLFFYGLCVENQLINNVTQQQFIYWFDLVGIQRHLKVLGIFARLYHRDGKAGYLQEIPRILQYIFEASEKYSELDGLNNFISGIIKK